MDAVRACSRRFDEWDPPDFELSAQEIQGAITEVERQLAVLPTREVASLSWRDNGIVMVAEDTEEAVRLSDEYAPEHLELHVSGCGVLHQPAHLLRLALHRRGDHSRLQGQDDRHGPHPAHQLNGPVHGRSLGRQVPENVHFSAYDSGSQQRSRRDHGKTMQPREHVGPRHNREGTCAEVQKNVIDSSFFIAIID